MPTWNELFTQEAFRWKVPHRAVVRFAELLKKDSRAGTIFDLGCGAGRHMVYLAQQGFRMIGSDISPNGLIHGQNWLRNNALPSDLYLGDMTCLALADESVDALISIHTIFHNPKDRVRRSLDEMRRILKPGGLALFSMLSCYCSRLGHGEMVEPHTYITDIGNDAGVPHHFYDLVELTRELEAFKTMEIRHDEFEAEGEIHAHWIVLAQKPFF